MGTEYPLELGVSNLAAIQCPKYTLADWPIERYVAVNWPKCSQKIFVASKIIQNKMSFCAIFGSFYNLLTFRPGAGATFFGRTQATAPLKGFRKKNLQQNAYYKHD